MRDRGPGLPSGEEQRVFEKFFRGQLAGARGAAAGTRGAGLGLAICRAIVNAHGGSIEARQREGGGVVMRLRLPIGGTPPRVPALA